MSESSSPLWEDRTISPDELPRASHDVLLLPASEYHLSWAFLVRDLVGAVAEDFPLSLHVVQDREDDPHVQQVVVAPSTMRGLVDAAKLISAWPSTVVPPALLVVRDTLLPPPPSVVRLARTLAGRVRWNLEIPYLPELRLVAEPAQALQSKRRGVARARRILTKIRKTLCAATYIAAFTPLPATEPSLALEVPPPPLTNV